MPLSLPVIANNLVLEHAVDWTKLLADKANNLHLSISKNSKTLIEVWIWGVRNVNVDNDNRRSDSPHTIFAFPDTVNERLQNHET